MSAAEREAFVPDARLAGAFITVGLVALFGGMVTGLLQALTLAGIEIPAHFLVVGSRGLGAVRRLLLGTVSEKVLQHALCPVLIVKGSGTPAG